MKAYAPISLAALILALYACHSTAHARELTSADLRRIEGINQSRNREVYADHWRGNSGPCTIYATNKAMDLIRAGYGPDVALAVVFDEHGQQHEVAEVFGALNGKPSTIVLDSRFNWTLTRKDAEAYGYSWIAEFKPEPAP